jgi:hypothetical protein
MNNQYCRANKRSDLRYFCIEFSNLFPRPFRTLGKKLVEFSLYLFHLGLSDRREGERSSSEKQAWLVARKKGWIGSIHHPETS